MDYSIKVYIHFRKNTNFCNNLMCMLLFIMSSDLNCNLFVLFCNVNLYIVHCITLHVFVLFHNFFESQYLFNGFCHFSHIRYSGFLENVLYDTKIELFLFLIYVVLRLRVVKKTYFLYIFFRYLTS